MDDLQRLARDSPTPEQAEQAAHHLDTQSMALRQSHSFAFTRPVLLQFGTQPLFIAANNTLQDDLLKLCGAIISFPVAQFPGHR